MIREKQLVFSLKYYSDNGFVLEQYFDKDKPIYKKVEGSWNPMTSLLAALLMLMTGTQKLAFDLSN